MNNKHCLYDLELDFVKKYVEILGGMEVGVIISILLFC